MKQICAHCGTQGKIKYQARGSLLGELALWVLAFLIALPTAYISLGVALVFSLWRAIDKKKICGECGHDELVGVDTPRGKKLMDEYR
jgi:hypothetical protein